MTDKTFRELRAEKANDASLWTPVDALSSMLRDIKAGRSEPDVVIIFFRERGSNRVRFVQSSPDANTAVGVAHEGCHRLLATKCKG